MPIINMTSEELVPMDKSDSSSLNRYVSVQHTLLNFKELILLLLWLRSRAVCGPLHLLLFTLFIYLFYPVIQI